MGKDLRISALLDVYGSCLNPKQKELTEHYYNEDLSLSEIAENEGITRQGVRDLIKRAEQRLFELEKNMHYCEKFSKLKALSTAAHSGDKQAVNDILDIIENL